MPAGMLRIKTFDELEALGRALSGKADGLSTELSLIRVQADPASVCGSGAASQYQLAFEKWSTAQTNLIDSLRSMGQFLDSDAAAYRSQDEKIQRGFDLI